jgi:hypothetical protein
LPDAAALRELFSARPAVLRFSDRAASIPGDYRVSWRLSIVVLLLQRGRAKSLQLEHLHVLWWAVRSAATRELLLRFLDGNGRPDEMLVRFDPSLSVTLDLAIGAGLVDVDSNGKVTVTATGIALAASLRDEPVLTAEKQFIEQLPRSITKAQFARILDWK